MSGADLQGRPYLTFDQAAPGVSITLDGDFTCAKEGARKVLKGKPGALYFHCGCGRHMLDGQADFAGGQFYVGVYPADTSVVS